jgi:hypothetical protein
MSGSVERRNEFVTMPRRAGWEILRPREIQLYALEREGQLGHDKSPDFGTLPDLGAISVGISPAALFVRKMGCRSRQRIDLDQCGMSQRGGA